MVAWLMLVCLVFEDDDGDDDDKYDDVEVEKK